MLSEYPKEVKMKDGSNFVLRPMIRHDEDGLYRFYVKLGENVRKYLRNDIQSRVLIEKWCRNLDYDKVLPILAEKNGSIIANATLHREKRGWSKHIGEIRMTISSEYRYLGLGTLLVGEVIRLAEKSGLEKLMVKIVTSRDYVIKFFEQNDFVRVSVLKNFVKSIHENRYRDIAILVKDLKSRKLVEPIPDFRALPKMSPEFQESCELR